MPRVKRGYTLRRRRKRLLKLASGFRGPRGNLYRIAREAVDRALNYAYRDRRARKRDFRRLWIARINAAARLNDMSYSRFIAGLAKANVVIDRKILSDIALSDPGAFTRIAAIARES